MSSLILTPDSISLGSLRSLGPLSPYSQPAVVVKTDPLTVLTPTTPTTPLANYGLLAVNPSVLVKPRLVIDVDIDSGLNDSYVVQKDITLYFMNVTLEKWIYGSLSSILEFLVSKNGKIHLVKNMKERDSNNIDKDSTSVLEAKSDWLKDHILSESKTRAILVKIMGELELKWFELPHRESLVKEVMKRYLKNKLKRMVSGEDDDDE
jgi:hypothetical protein